MAGFLDSVNSGISQVPAPVRTAVDVGGGAGIAEVAPAISGVTDYLGEANPLKKRTTTPYDPTAPTPISGPKIPDGSTAPTVGQVPIGSPQIHSVADPRMTMINAAPQDQFRSQQLGLAQQLAAQANGTGPSITDRQYQKASANTLAQNLALMNSARGGANPGVIRNAMEANAEQQGQMAVDAGTSRLQEQMSAAGLLNSVASGARGQDLSLATSQAGLDQQTNLAKYEGNLRLALAQGQIDENQFNQLQQNARQNAQMQENFQNLQMKYRAMGLDADKANQMAALEIQRLKSGNIQNANAANTEDQNRRDNILGQVFSGSASTAATALKGGSASDSAASGLTTMAAG